MNFREDAGTSHFTSDVVAGALDENANAIELSGAVTGVAPDITPVGDDTHISLKLGKKGTAQIIASSRICETRTVTTDATAGALTYTAAMLLGGLILRDPNGGNRSDVTPTAALLAAAIPGLAAGHSFEFTIRNTADAAETITVTAGDSATLSGTMTIAQNNSKRFLVVFDTTAAYTVYSLGTVVH